MLSRIKKIISKDVGGMHEAAYLIGSFAFISQLLGFVRDRLLASKFGASIALDTYYASFRIPDLLFTIISTLVSLSVLVPLIIRLENKTQKERDVFANTVFTIVSIVSIFFVLVALIVSKPLLNIMFPVIMSGQYSESLLIMTRIMLLQPIILALSGLYGSYIQVYKKFFIYAISPIVYNIGIISGVVFLYPLFGMPGLVLGVIIGALFHLAIQIPTILEKGPRLKFTLYPNLDVVKEILSLSVPRTLALAGNQISQIVLIILAGTMVSGSISIFSLAFNLQSVPLAIIGMSYSLAVFPALSRFFNSGDMNSFISHISKATRHIIFWSVPIMTMFIILREQIVRTVLGSGSFDWDDTKLVAACLAIFSLSVVAQSLSLLFVRVYYSAGETKRPLIFVIISVAVTIISSFVLINLFKYNQEFRNILESTFKVNDVLGSLVLILPIAFSLGQIINTALLWIYFNSKYNFTSIFIWKTLLHSVLASVVAGTITFFALNIFSNVFDINTTLGIFLQGLFAGLSGLIFGYIFLVLIKNEEIAVIGGLRGSTS